MDQNTFVAALQASLGSHIPQILGAIAIFAIGWVIAVMARAATRRLLGLLAVNRRIEESTGAKVDAEVPVAVGVFWLIILGAVIAALTTLDLSTLSNPFSQMLGDILGYLPHLLAGLVLALVAWLIATVLRAAVGRALQMTSLDDKLSAAAGMAPMSRNVGNVLFWLVMLVFLPSILGAFRLEGTLGPVQTMLVSALDMLPNIFAAALIAFVGYVVARVLRGLVVNLLAAAGADALSERVGLDGARQDLAPGRHDRLHPRAGAFADRGARRAEDRGRVRSGHADAEPDARGRAAHHRGRGDPDDHVLGRALRVRAARAPARERRLRRAAGAPGHGHGAERARRGRRSSRSGR